MKEWNATRYTSALVIIHPGYLSAMAAATKRTGKKKRADDPTGNTVSEPQAVYTRKAPRRNKPKQPSPQGYNAKRSAGMIPGLATRMKEYLKSMRDER
ncbi:MAG: hypothetical protein JST41_04950 [Bacteroidetes bacterium]|nr:hypothetical protein [Bacteroidota bacterium]HMU15033.1 hypothetical protein [Flavobacteriales bacterium]HMW96585.1 hypothetical protein [Flavobacteriales bacterium]HNA33608.1 hypothetical protein [Flavobacteriales bacterium]HNE81428.1 hypothetical protein [Flavobacteriales bacterium]